jgi:hypothetical protein
MPNRRFDYIRTAGNVGFDGLHRKEFARGDLLQCGRVKDQINAMHCLVKARQLADISQIKAEPIAIQLLPHLLLLELVAAEDPDFPASLAEKLLDHRPAKRTGAAGD